MIREFWEIYYVDETGKLMDHKDQREHEELTFLNEDQAFGKATQLMSEGHEVEIWHMGPV